MPFTRTTFLKFVPGKSLSLLYIYPILLYSIIGFLVIPYRWLFYREIFTFICLSGLFYSFGKLFTKRRLKNIYLIVTITIANLFAFIKTSFYIKSGAKISASSIYVVFETYKTELNEYLLSYFSPAVIITLILFTIPIVIACTYIFRKETANLDFLFFIGKSRKYNGLLAILYSTCFFLLILLKGKEESIILNLSNYYTDYTRTKNILKRELSKEQSTNLSSVTSCDEEQVHVVIVGESTSRWHMGIYGYNRKTNPLLSKIKEDLTIYNNVITSNTITIQSLDKALTLSDNENPYRSSNASIVQLANEAGFETYWISNQKPIGSSETIPTLIANAAKHKYFVSTEASSYNIHDGKLLPVLDQVLTSTKVKKKLIFLHLMGTHNIYKRRYPEKYKYFTNKNNSSNKSDRANSYINEYDNAVRYNDFVVYEVIRKIDALKSNSFVSYFSDHGDEVFDVKDYLGHDAVQTTQAMHDIPFITWTSKKYRKSMRNTICQDLCIDKPFLLEDYFYSFADLANIEFAENKIDRSFFNRNYICKKRLLKSGENYDSLYIQHVY